VKVPAPMAERFLLSSVLCRRAFDGRLQRTSTNYCISAGHVEIHLHTVQRCATRSGLYESINQPKYLPCRNLIRWRLRRSPEEKPLSRLPRNSVQSLFRDAEAAVRRIGMLFRSPPARPHCHSGYLAHLGPPRPDLAN
jgi:hypothetical protein